MAITATLGSLTIHSIKDIKINLPTIHSHKVNGQGMAGYFDKWDGYYPEPSTMTTVTFLAKGSAAQAFQATANSYVKSSQTLTIDNAIANSDTYVAKIVSVEIHMVAAPVNDGVGSGLDTMATCIWTMECRRA
jgi:hypothetical protein